MIDHNLSVASNCKQIPGSFFQILGLDILPSEDLTCYLLEINDHPSLDIYVEKGFMGGGTKARHLSLIDQYVKTRVVGDSIKLTKKWR